MKTGSNRSVFRNAGFTVALAVTVAASQVTVYRPDSTSYLLTGSWAIGLKAVTAVTRNDSVLEYAAPAAGTVIPDRLTVTSKITPSESGYSIDMMAPNPWFDCIVYREFNRETSRFTFSAGSNPPRQVLGEERNDRESLFSSEAERKRAGVSFTWSPDGKAAVCITGKKLQILAYQSSKAVFSTVRTIPVEGDNLFSPSWYDTSAVLFVQNRRIVVLDIAVGDIRNVRIEGGFREPFFYEIAVSVARPELCMVVCASSANDNLQLWKGTFTGTKLRLERRLPPVGKSLENSKPVWSPQGDRIAFVTGDRSKGGRNWQKNVAVIPITSGGGIDSVTVVPFDHSVFPDANLCWSDDGSTIWFIYEDMSMLKLACADVSPVPAPVRTISVIRKERVLDGIREVTLSGRRNEMRRLAVVAAPRATEEILVSDEAVSRASGTVVFTPDSPPVTVLNFRDAADARDADCRKLTAIGDSIRYLRLESERYLETKIRSVQGSFWVQSFQKYVMEQKKMLLRKEQEYSIANCQSDAVPAAGAALRKRIDIARSKLQSFSSYVADTLGLVSEEEFSHISRVAELYNTNLAAYYDIVGRSGIPWTDGFFTNMLEERRVSARKADGTNQVAVMKINLLLHTAKDRVLEDRLAAVTTITTTRQQVAGFSAEEKSVGAAVKDRCLHRLDSLLATIAQRYAPIQNDHRTMMGLLSEKEVAAIGDKIAGELDALDRYVGDAVRETGSIRNWFSALTPQWRQLLGRKQGHPDCFTDKYIETWTEINGYLDSKAVDDRPFSRWKWEELAEAVNLTCRIDTTAAVVSAIIPKVDGWLAAKGNDKKVREFNFRWQKIKELVRDNADARKKLISALNDARKMGAVLEASRIRQIESRSCEQCKFLFEEGKCK